MYSTPQSAVLLSRSHGTRRYKYLPILRTCLGPVPKKLGPVWDQFGTGPKKVGTGSGPADDADDDPLESLTYLYDTYEYLHGSPRAVGRCSSPGQSGQWDLRRGRRRSLLWTGEEETALDSGIRELGRLRTEGAMSAAQRSTNDELSRFHWSTDLSSTPTAARRRRTGRGRAG